MTDTNGTGFDLLSLFIGIIIGALAMAGYILWTTRFCP
jgi:hypothetical protein